MNYHQLKQKLLNNLWHGENHRRQNSGYLLAEAPYLYYEQLAYALVQPDYSRPWFIDIGYWEWEVDLSVTKAMGATCVYIKGIDGTLPVKYYVKNYNKAVEVGLARAPYAWLYRNANVSCVAQAQALHNLNQQYPPSLPSVIDFEPTNFQGMPSNPNYSDLRKWVVEWLRLGNPKPILYSGKYYMDQFGRIPEDLKAMFAGLWIAQYTPGGTAPTLPAGYTEYIHHQFTDHGDAELLAPNTANTKEVDLDYQYEATPIPPEPEEPMGTIGHVKGTARSTTNMKAMTSGTVKAVMASGDVVYGEWSTQKTDLINFDHYYKQGVRVELGELCKCVVTNLTCVEETEPGGTPPPTTGNKSITVTIDLDGYKSKAIVTELEPE